MKDLSFHIAEEAPNQRAYIDAVMNSGNFAGNGAFTQKVQSALTQHYQGHKVLLTHSCTAALEMAAMMEDLTPNDEVIIPSFTFCSTASAFLRTGAKIVFCDIDPTTMMARPDDYACKLSDKTKVLVIVHYGGLSADTAAIKADPRFSGLSIVEDAAQTFGACLNGKPLGLDGRFGCVSFHQTKNVHGGLAGALILNNTDDLDRARQIWERGTNRQNFIDGRADRYTWTENGSSFYPSELQAALLLAQIEHAETITSKRRALYLSYHEALKPLRETGLIHFPELAETMEPNGHIFWVQTQTADQAKALRADLKRQGIDAPAHYFPLHISPMGAKLGHRPEDCPASVDAAERLVRLPLHTQMDEAGIIRVANAVMESLSAATGKRAA